MPTLPLNLPSGIVLPVISASGMKSTVTLPAFTINPYTPDPSKVLFKGDFSPGNASQWPWIDAKGYSGSGSGLAAAITAGKLPPYTAQMITDPAAPSGKAFRVELHQGDPRCEVASNSGNSTLAGGYEGDTRWYEFGLKFDSVFPASHPNWGLCFQFKSPGLGSPMLGWYFDRKPGHVSLTVTPQSGPAVYTGSPYSLYDIALPKTWVWITMRVTLSVKATVGTIELWVNQKRATFNDGTQTHHAVTLMPNCQVQPVNSFVKLGYYRDPNSPFAAAIYHSGFRCCTDKSGLARPVSLIG
jgi:Polysaccharide lyase